MAGLDPPRPSPLLQSAAKQRLLPVVSVTERFEILGPGQMAGTVSSSCNPAADLCGRTERTTTGESLDHLIDLNLLDAARRGGRTALATALRNERVTSALQHRPVQLAL